MRSTKPIMILMVCAGFTSAFAQTNPIRQFAELIASDGHVLDGFGNAVAINGITVVVGAESSNSYKGAAYVYVSGGSKANAYQVAELRPSDAFQSDLFGFSVAISGDTIVVGSPGAGNADMPGSAYVFV